MTIERNVRKFSHCFLALGIVVLIAVLAWVSFLVRKQVSLTNRPQIPALPCERLLPRDRTAACLASDPGDWAGSGNIDLYSDNLQAKLDGEILTLLFPDGTNALFAAAGRAPLAPGLYGDAIRLAEIDEFPQHPGLEVARAGHGCNHLDGRFEILALTFSENELQRVELRFEQHCEGLSPAWRGYVRFDRAGELG